MKQSLLNS